MPDVAKDHRLNLLGSMQPKKDYGNYKKDLENHKYVICTPGDRPDTYRLWETLACGAIPICIDNSKTRELLGVNAVYVDNFSPLSVENALDSKIQGNPMLAQVSYWKSIVEYTYPNLSGKI